MTEPCPGFGYFSDRGQVRDVQDLYLPVLVHRAGANPFYHASKDFAGAELYET